MLNAWDSQYLNLTDEQRQAKLLTYGPCQTAYKAGAAFLDGLAVEDWGCGYGAFKEHHRGPYKGIDGTKGPWVDVHADLREYLSNTPGLFIRGVLEHNHDWQAVLANAVASFQKRMFLAVFTPMEAETRVIVPSNGTVDVPDISFKLEDITDRLVGCTFTVETIPTETQYNAETLFRIERA